MTSKNMTASHAVKSACRTFFASLATTVVAGLSLSSQAATTITVDSVVQRWPWNNKVDITYTVNDGQDVANSKFCNQRSIKEIGIFAQKMMGKNKKMVVFYKKCRFLWYFFGYSHFFLYICRRLTCACVSRA